jgi:hypothetical protein
VRGAFGQDPRPDLTEDTERWVRLLALAWAYDGADADGAYQALLGARCLAARLENGTLTPRESEGWADHRQRYLLPHKDAIKHLLALSCLR